MTLRDFDPNDRDGWRYSFGGRPVEVTSLFLGLIRGELRGGAHLADAVTIASLATWEAYVSDNQRIENQHRTWEISLTVRHPGPDICYVFCLPGHPDQTEPVLRGEAGPELVTAEIVTLLYDSTVHDWRVHTFGGMLDPADVGLERFPKP